MTFILVALSQENLLTYDLRFRTGNLPDASSYQIHQITGQTSKYGILEYIEK